MFTGIIEDIGTIIGIAKSSGKWEIHIKTTLQKQEIQGGESISIDGACLTVTRVTQEGFCADASLETLSVTTLKEKKVGVRVNLERAMRYDGRFGGHIVMGHVDGVGTITDIKKEGESAKLTIEVPENISKYIVKKGSVAIDGISLTVNEQGNNIFTVNIIPFTASKTTIIGKKVRDTVNIETDIIGKYVESFVDKTRNKGVDLNFLYEHGYTKGE